MLKMFLVSAAICGASSISAYAWEVMIEGPDVFGVTKAFALESGTQTDLAIQCNTDGNLVAALIFPIKKYDEIPEVTAELYISVGDEAPVILEAKTRNWNDDYGGVVASNIEDVGNLIISIRDAKSVVKVGAVIRGNRVSDNFSSRGSTTSMQRLSEACRLNQ